MVRIAVLDDYQGIAAEMADWPGRLPGAEVRFFHEHIRDPEVLVTALEPYEVIVAMRERTPFPEETLARLPRLRLLVTTGSRNASIASWRPHVIAASWCRARAASPEVLPN